ncbi:MAG TPA: carboxymuconolactone decarboxylase family protein [Kofleriaceae bacterium]|nr:carboxymuconolactone decarboxylase family protein [Kofleriaceae bacterium]
MSPDLVTSAAQPVPPAPTAALDALRARLPDHLRDLRLNLAVVTGASGLTPRQHWGTALAAALAARNPEVVRAIASAAAPHLDEAARRAAETAASLMAMNNVYYRFLHFVGDAAAGAAHPYQGMPARLRMQAIANPGVDHLDFELWCLAVSAVNGCGACVVSHEKVVRDKGATTAMVQDAVRIAAVVHALAASLDGVAALA